MILALIVDNVVASIATVSTEEEIQALGRQYALTIDITNANPQPTVGWVFDGNQLVLGPGMAAIAATRKITKLGLRRRLTFTELCALESASATIPAVAALKGNLTVANYVDLNRADTLAGIGMLVSLGLVTSDRAAAILGAAITEEERYRGNE